MKKVKLLITEPIPFTIDGRTVLTDETLSVEDAEVIAAQYPGLYVDVVEEKPKKDNGPEKTQG